MIDLTPGTRSLQVHFDPRHCETETILDLVMRCEAALPDMLTMEVETRTVDVHVRALRKKLGGEIIETVIGAGYRFRGYS